jgi:glycine C-acetyltransferase
MGLTAQYKPGAAHQTGRDRTVQNGGKGKNALQYYSQQLKSIQEAGTQRVERVITSPQKSRINTTDAPGLVNLCANNYLGLSNDRRIIQAAKSAFDVWGFGLSSVRFICGTQLIHKQLEKRLAEFIQMEDAILYSSCFDANGGLFETLLGEEDAVISDELNHASIIDGIRLCKAERLRYRNSDMKELEQRLRDTQGRRIRLIATDGVFSMDGYVARLGEICDLAEQYDALVMVDDSHATGFMGKFGCGTHEHCGVIGRVDIITGTFGKALGGASGGFTAARKPIVDLLRQRSRPYLFSNSLAPAICAATVKTLDVLESSTALRDKVHENARYFRGKMSVLGFDLLPGEHPIVPVMLYDAHLAAEMAARMLGHGVYVIPFSYPVVPFGRARIRTQISAAHSQVDLDLAVEAFRQVKIEMNY